MKIDTFNLRAGLKTYKFHLYDMLVPFQYTVLLLRFISDVAFALTARLLNNSNS